MYDGDGDAHYDTISAFIKSMRASDPDAALYWLAKMLYAGEDLRFIARRIVIAASEDVGMADSNALRVAVAAQQAVEFIGMPEARTPLAHATVYIATAPKSNRAYLAIDAALDDVKTVAPCPCQKRCAASSKAASPSATARATCIRTTPKAASFPSAACPRAKAGFTTILPATDWKPASRNGSTTGGSNGRRMASRSFGIPLPCSTGHLAPLCGMAFLGERNILRVVRYACMKFISMQRTWVKYCFRAAKCRWAPILARNSMRFLYRDSEDRLVATVAKPYAVVGEIAVLKVRDYDRRIGAFLDWGLRKDLLLPHREQTTTCTGYDVVVYVALDDRTDRIFATMRLWLHLTDEMPTYDVGQPVELLIAKQSELGWNAVVEGKHLGLIYYDLVNQPLHIGQKITG